MSAIVQVSILTKLAKNIGPAHLPVEPPIQYTLDEEELQALEERLGPVKTDPRLEQWKRFLSFIPFTRDEYLVIRMSGLCREAVQDLFDIPNIAFRRVLMYWGLGTQIDENFVLRRMKREVNVGGKEDFNSGAVRKND